jgi:hypothetical protein
VNILVATTADHQSLAPPLGHEVHPGGLLTSTRPIEVGELADVMNLQVRPGVADLAILGEEPVDQLVAPSAGDDRLVVGEVWAVARLEQEDPSP